jgi:hypothetical protein
MEPEWSAHFQRPSDVQGAKGENTLNARDAAEEATFKHGHEVAI